MFWISFYPKCVKIITDIKFFHIYMNGQTLRWRNRGIRRLILNKWLVRVQFIFKSVDFSILDFWLKTV